MNKVIFLSYYFPPVGGTGVQRAHNFVLHLPAEGFLPIVIAAPARIDDKWAPSDPSLLAKVPSNIPVHRVSGPMPLSTGKLRSRLERWLNLTTAFEDWWCKSAVELACQVGDGASLIFATMSPFDSARAANEISRRLNIPWVADLRDPWALDDIQIYPTRIHRKLEMRKMERHLSSASAIIMNTPAAAAALRSEIPSLRNKLILSITNGFDAEDFSQAVQPRTNGKFRIVHSGGMFTATGLQLKQRSFYRFLGGAEPGVDILARSPEYLLRAVEQWASRRPEVAKDLEIVFAGNMSQEDRDLVHATRASQFVEFPGFMSHADSLHLIRTADLLFLAMHNLPPGKKCRSIPGKAFEYIASGRPILAAVPDGDARDFLGSCGTALLSRPDDVERMVLNLDEAYLAWKVGKDAAHPDREYAARFERRALTHALADVFRTVLGEPAVASESESLVGAGAKAHAYS